MKIKKLKNKHIIGYKLIMGGSINEFNQKCSDLICDDYEPFSNLEYRDNGLMFQIFIKYEKELIESIFPDDFLIDKAPSDNKYPYPDEFIQWLKNT